MSIEFEGLNEVLNALEAPVSEEKLTQVLTKACLLIERAAKQKAPKGNGALRNSITSEVREEGGDIVGVVYTPLEYAPYVEYGTGLFAEGGNGRQDVPWVYCDEKGEFHSTSGMKPQPFMRPALDENREEIMRILREGLLNG